MTTKFRDELYTEAGLNMAVQQAANAGVEVDDDTARAIASAWHGGQGSAFYSFASTGHYDRDALLSELSDVIHASYTLGSPADRLMLDHMGTYLINRR